MSRYERHVFSIAPLEMVADRRLSAALYRVLLALLSYRSGVGNLVWPSRETLAELTGYTVQNISRYTTQLDGLGWLKKDGIKPIRYALVVPDLAKEVSNHDTKNNQEVSYPDTQEVSYPDTCSIEEETKEETNKQKKVNQKKILLPSGFCISDRVKSWAVENGHDQLERHLESFLLKCEAKGYRYKNWDSAFMNAIRDNWAKLEVCHAADRQVGRGCSRREHHANIGEIADRLHSEAVARELGNGNVSEVSCAVRREVH